MQYNIFLVCIALSATSSSASGRYDRAIGKDNNNNNNMEFVGRPYAYKDVANRQRRSALWKMFVDHVDRAVETFHPRPLLIGAVNGVDGLVGNKFDGEIRQTSKTANAMLSEGAAFKDEPFNGAKIKTKLVENTKQSIRQTIESLKGKKTIADESDLIKVRTDIVQVNKMHLEAQDLEDQLLIKLCRLCRQDIESTELKSMYMMGIKSNHSENTLRLIMTFYDGNFSEKLKKYIDDIETFRKELQHCQSQITKHILPRLAQEEIKNHKRFYKKLYYIGQSNKKWLDTKFPHTIFDEQMKWERTKPNWKG